MTTIVVGFDENGIEIVAADRMSSRPEGTPEGERCRNCDEPASLYRLTNKIRLPSKDVMFRGSKILYASGSGRSVLIERLIRLLYQGEDIAKVWKNNLTLTGNHSHGTACIVVRTEDKLWILDCEGTKFKEQSFTTDDFPVCSGSGSPAARFYLQLNPAGGPSGAVQAAHFGDTYSQGCDVHAPFNKDYVPEQPLTDIDEFRKALLHDLKPPRKTKKK